MKSPTVKQRRVMLEVAYRPNSTTRSLAQMFLVSVKGIWDCLRACVWNGFIRDPLNKRGYAWKLTDAGKAEIQGYGFVDGQDDDVYRPVVFQ